MNISDEIFDIVNDEDVIIGSAPRREVHASDLKHRAVHVWLMNPSGEVFVQKRSASKDCFPGCFDSSASGHVDQGEDYDTCAYRELHEELAVIVPVGTLQRQFKLPASVETGWEFVWVYILRGDYIPQINLQEIEAGAYWSLDHIQNLVTERPVECAPSFCRIFREFKKLGLL